MEWEPLGYSDLLVGGKPVSVRSLRCQDEEGNWHRYRICSVWDFSSEKFTPRAAWARLARNKQGRIGVLLSGANFAFVKVGRRQQIQNYIFTSFNTISKKAQKGLLKQAEIDLFEEDGVVLGWEKGEET
jgi:hypothetical protein